MMNNVENYYGVNVSENPELVKWMKDVDEFLDTVYHDRGRLNNNFKVFMDAHNKLGDRVEELENTVGSLRANNTLLGFGLLAISVSGLLLWWSQSETDEQVAQLSGEMETMREKIRTMADAFNFDAK